MKSIRILSLLLVITLLANACKKNDPNPAGEKTAMLKKAWKVSKVEQTGQSTPLYQSPLPYGQHNVEDYSRYQLTFTSDTQYSVTEKDGATRTGTWKLNNNATQLLLDKGVVSQEEVLDLLEVQGNFLTIRTTETSTKTGTRELTIYLIPAR